MKAALIGRDGALKRQIAAELSHRGIAVRRFFRQMRDLPRPGSRASRAVITRAAAPCVAQPCLCLRIEP